MSKEDQRSLASTFAETIEAALLNDLDASGPRLSTGCMALDYVLGGGIPTRIITELVGDFSTGKTLIGLQICREVIRAGGIAVFADAERALNKEWATQTLGIDPEGLVVVEAAALEDVYERLEGILEEVAKQEISPFVFVWDSIAATPARAVKDDEGSKMAAQARVNSERLQNITEPLAKSGGALVLLNQLRSKIGVRFGKRWESCGGRAVRFYSSLRLHVRTLGKRKSGKRTVGVKGRLELIKSRISRPFIGVDFDIDFNRGIVPWSGTIELLKRAGLLTGAGGTYQYELKNGTRVSCKPHELPKHYRQMWKAADDEALKQALERGFSKEGD